MDIFRTIQTKLAVLGINSSNQAILKNAFNRRVLFGFLLFGCTVISELMYIFHVASGFMESMDIISATFGSILVFVSFATMVSKRTSLFESINNLEKFIGASKKIVYTLQFIEI